MTTQTFDNKPQAPRLPLWFGFSAGPLAWTAHLLVSYFIASAACDGGEATVKALLFATSAVFVAISIFGALTSLRLWREEYSASNRTGTRHARLLFMELSGVVLGGYFAIAVMMESIPILALDACRS